MACLELGFVECCFLILIDKIVESIFDLFLDLITSIILVYSV